MFVQSTVVVLCLLGAVLTQPLPTASPSKADGGQKDSAEQRARRDAATGMPMGGLHGGAFGGAPGMPTHMPPAGFPGQAPVQNGIGAPAPPHPQKRSADTDAANNSKSSEETSDHSVKPAVSGKVERSVDAQKPPAGGSTPKPAKK